MSYLTIDLRVEVQASLTIQSASTEWIAAGKSKPCHGTANKIFKFTLGLGKLLLRRRKEKAVSWSGGLMMFFGTWLV
jgi:hypothetical protein